MADISGFNRTTAPYANNRVSTGNNSVSRLINFLNANTGQTQKLSEQVNKSLEGQGDKFQQDLNQFAFGHSSFNPGEFNKAASGLKMVSNLSNQLQTKSGLENVVGAATKSSNPYASKLDTELLLKDPNAVADIKNRVNDKFNYGFNRINELLSGRGYQALDKSLFGQKPITNLQSYYEDQNAEPEYYEEYDDQGSFGEDVGNASVLDVLNYYRKNASNPEKLDLAGKVGSAVFGGPAGMAAYNAIPQEIKDKLLTKTDKIAQQALGKDYINVNQPIKMATSPYTTSLNLADKIIPIAKPVENFASSIGSSIGSFFKKLCFAPHTIIKMHNGTVKYIKDIEIGDVLFEGGEVYSIKKEIANPNDFYIYGENLVTGSHAVKENGKWVRVENSKNAVKTSLFSEYIVTLSNKNHTIITSDGTIFADYDEVNNSENLTLDECLNKLNGK